ncbi:hypothetical protein FB45DRAFT_1050317 [Roridomyces roridus]|uniref:Protein kinase domain-containing protein n=1 Tax=Roridomyces roridus TaxID=1738132 RepID=A0AAD7CLG3_9AGAR|nr:hypothetical protein FB45DRAFT_1050317 [Roridomyces roridus]
MSTVGSSSIRIRFEGSSRNYTFTAREWAIPDHDGPFHALPPEATHFLIQRDKSLFTNGPGCRLREEVELDTARRWGYSDEESVIFARASSSRGYCMRFIFNATHVLRHTLSQPYQAYLRLSADAEFHSLHLDVLEGRIAPRHYGMWVMETGEWAGKVLLSITDYCGVSWNDLELSKLSNEANRQRIGRALEMMHDLNINHGDLGSDMRHVLLDIHGPDLSPGDLSAGRVNCYITDFSSATTHKCTRKLPVLPLDAWALARQVGCREIHQVLHHLQFMPSAKAHEASLVTRALEWYEKYTEEYPNEHSVDVRIAQRAQLFSQYGQIYPDIRVEIVSDPSRTIDRVCISKVA